MEDYYIYLLAVLAILAVADLVVGVSNDAANFLNSAVGSKAVSFKTILLVASLGVIFGALSSSGMMEIARKGIFNPGEFVFDEIMVIFMAVMLTDILLLDFFNTLGLPTSTTVSIVFELLGASVCVALIKISANNTQTILDLGQYINNEKALEIVIGILLSVVIAFTVGAVVQFVTRLLLTFDFKEKPIWYGAFFGGISITSIIYFILIKGLKSSPFMDSEMMKAVTSNTFFLIAGGVVIWSVISYLMIKFFRINIYTLIIIFGTFALAMAFAGNDMVNFIGVPIAAFNSWEAWSVSGISPSMYSMTVLEEQIQTQPLILLFAGLIMVLTLWFSSKARAVIKTSVDLSRQEEVKERFEPNYLSRGIVRSVSGVGRAFNYFLPKSAIAWIDTRLTAPTTVLAVEKKEDLPAFDLVRAAVNLMVASLLISMATSMKLPLSTTYVTFMVAMGTSLADRAWGSESAVYRVAGVLNVIGGWFFTAISAFVAASIMALILYYGKGYALVGLVLLAIFLLGKNFLSHQKQSKQIKEADSIKKAESSSTQGVIYESASNIANVVKRGNKIYTSAINGLATQDLAALKKNKKNINKLSKEIEELNENVFYFIKNLDEPSVQASNFYLHVVSYLQDMAQSLEYISKISHKHVNNNHKKLKFSQIKELKEVDERFERFFSNTQKAFETNSFEDIGIILGRKKEIMSLVTDKIQKQVERTRKEESSPKNTTLYFNILLETKDLLTATMNLLEEYYNAHDSSVAPAKPNLSE